MKLSWLPSKFALGNSLFSLIIFLSFALPFALFNYPVALIAWVMSPFISYGIVRLHRSRAKQYELMHPPTDAEFMYRIQTGLDQLQSDFDNFTLQVTIRQPEGG